MREILFRDFILRFENWQLFEISIYIYVKCNVAISSQVVAIYEDDNGQRSFWKEREREKVYIFNSQHAIPIS